MKRIIPLLVVLLCGSLYAQHGTINIQTNMDSTTILQYAIDTLESYQVAPGVIYTRFNITSTTNTRHCYIYEVDLNNPYNRVEECHSTTMGNTELMTTTHTRLDSAGHRSVGSVNCNFWYVGSTDEGGKNNLLGVGATGQVRNGKIGASITSWEVAYDDPRQAVGFLMMDATKHAFVDQYSWNATARIGENTYPISESNRNRNNPSDNELVLFNSDLGTKTTLTKSVIDTRLGKEVDMLEVVVKLQGDWAINQDLPVTVVSTNTVGGTLISDGYAVLRGRGTGLTFLQNLKVGDNLTLHIGIYNSLTNETPAIEQLTAGNCLVMKDGRLTSRNWNETYNNQNYPRTGFACNATHDKLWLMVMEKPGMFTHEMCSIFRHFGATDAAGADGGGSAQFNLRGQILNPTTEGTPRAVSNSIFLFSTAPDDSVVTEMRSSSTFLRLPKHATYHPTFLGYNQYGMLISTNLPDVRLSCDPSVGYITEDNSFVCLGSGILTAQYGEATLPINIQIADDATYSIRLDSVLISDRTPYSIEINGEVDNKSFQLLPSALSWTVDDPDICTVTSEGVLTALQNGKTTIKGTMGTTTLTQDVTVQIPDSNMLLWEDMIALQDRWQVSQTSKNYNTRFEANEQGIAELAFTYTGGRGPSIRLGADSTLYSTPKFFELQFTPTDSVFEKVTIGLRANNSKTTTAYRAIALIPNQVNHIRIDIDSLFQANGDIAIYPVYLEYINFSINTKTAKTDYRMPFHGIYIYYDNIPSTDLPSVVTPSNTDVQKVFHNGQLYIIYNGHIYNLIGNEVTHKH